MPSSWMSGTCLLMWDSWWSSRRRGKLFVTAGREIRDPATGKAILRATELVENHHHLKADEASRRELRRQAGARCLDAGSTNAATLLGQAGYAKTGGSGSATTRSLTVLGAGGMAGSIKVGNVITRRPPILAELH